VNQAQPVSALIDGQFDGGVALLSPSGWGNLGDAAILDSAIHAVRIRLPGTPLLALTLNPNDTAVRHGIAAFTCSGFSRPYYGVAEDGPVLASARPTEDQVQEVPRRWRSKYRSSLAIPLALWSGARAFPRDIQHRRRLAMLTGHLRLIVVAGGGQLDDFWGGAFGHPYVLWRWAQYARSTGAQFAVLSVGTGSLTTRLAHLFTERALSLATYRSFRDEGSRSLMRSPLVERDPVVPDLAYAFPVEQFRVGAQHSTDRPVIGISPIAYGDPRAWPKPDAQMYRDYLKRLATLAASLLDSRHDLVLFGTDSPDLLSVQDLMGEIAKLVPATELERVRVPPVHNLHQLYAALAGVHAVVASRLHGVLLTQLASIPVLALSYERKVETHMRTLDQEHFCLPVESFEPSLALLRLNEISEKRHDISASIQRAVGDRRRQVEQQYDAVLRGPAEPPRAAHAL
jgi:polysaccharide pyruvyl transferase WcaK-like protein